MRSRSGTRRTSRADVWPTLSGASRPTCQNHATSIFPANIDFLLVYATKCVAEVGRGAHRGRTPGQPLAGRPVLPVKNDTASTCFRKSWASSSSTLRERSVCRRRCRLWQEWDAGHVARCTLCRRGRKLCGKIWARVRTSNSARIASYVVGGRVGMGGTLWLVRAG